MTPLRFTSEITVQLASACCGSDRDLALAAWAVPSPVALEYGKDDTEAGWSRVLRACMKGKHNSVFEHGLLSVYAKLPGVVWWQLTRQRFMSLDSEDFSFNLESGRYKILDGLFYVPPPERPLIEPEGFKPMRPTLLTDADAAHDLANILQGYFGTMWETYRWLLDRGIAREVARLVLPNWALVIGGYVTGKPLTWLQFFSKRHRTQDTTTATYPMYEIEQFAAQCEELFAARWPITHAAFVAAARIAP